MSSSGDQKDFNNDIVPLFSTPESDHELSYEGDDGKVHLAETSVQLNITGIDTGDLWNYEYVVGFQITEEDILTDFHDAKDEIYVNLFIQLGIYILFLIVVFVFALWLAKLVVRNIVNPIDKLILYLDEKNVEKDSNDEPIMQNKEFNELSALFRQLFTLFKFSEADFFETTDQYELLRNYETARKLFDEIKNDRGKAICLNNMGNIQYDMGNYEFAKEKFIEAWQSTIILKETVDKEIKDEEESEENGAQSQLSKTVAGDKMKELSAIEDLIWHRMMQIVMAQEKSIEY